MRGEPTLPLRQAVVLVAVAMMFGVVAALMLRWSAPAWWVWQALGVLGAVVGGSECRSRRVAAIRGAVGGFVGAAAVVGAHAGFPGDDTVTFDPVSYPVFAVVVSAGLHVAGAVLRRRVTAKA